MTRETGSTRRPDHPLAGVLDRLLARERGDERGPPREPVPPPILDAATAPSVATAPSPVATPSPACVPAASRRMLVIAALGPDEGRAALREVARWALRNGRHPAALELGCGAPAPAGPTAPDASSSAGAPGVPWASVPCGPERIRAEPSEVIAEFLERLRRHETASDLLIVRIPPRSRMILMRAALLAGGIILPLDDSEDVLHEAYRLSREVMENFIDLALWPVTTRPRALERYLAIMRDFLGIRPRPFEMAEDPAILDDLPGAPEEGFIAAMLSPDDASPPSPLLQTGFLPV